MSATRRGGSAYAAERAILAFVAREAQPWSATAGDLRPSPTTGDWAVISLAMASSAAFKRLVAAEQVDLYDTRHVIVAYTGGRGRASPIYSDRVYARLRPAGRKRLGDRGEALKRLGWAAQVPPPNEARFHCMHCGEFRTLRFDPAEMQDLDGNVRSYSGPCENCQSHALTVSGGVRHSAVR